MRLFKSYAVGSALLSFLLCLSQTTPNAHAEPMATSFYSGEYVFYLDGPGCLYPGGYPLARKCPKQGYKPGWHLASIYRGKVWVDNHRLPRSVSTNTVRLAREKKQIANVDLEPNYIVRMVSPNEKTGKTDPRINKQWHHDFLHTSVAWKRTDSAVYDRVAVIDTGVDCSNAEISCLPGFNAFKNAENWEGTDDNGHGTHVAGLIAARADDNNGISGVAPTVRIVPVKVLNSQGSGSMLTVLKGLDYAKRQGIKVMSMSLGSYAGIAGFQSAINAVHNAGGYVVAAAGNDNYDLSRIAQYPCMYEHVVCVEAIGPAGKLANFTNYYPKRNPGPIGRPAGSVFVRSPGLDILSTWPGNAAGSVLDGTSMATPIVSGAIALSGRVPYDGSNLDLTELVDPKPHGCLGKKCRKCILNCSSGSCVQRCADKFRCTKQCKDENE